MEPSGPAHSGQDYIIIAAPPEAAEANALANELHTMGWPVMVTADVAPYASAARACVALVTPETINGPALQSALSSQPRNLIPVVTAPLPLPYGPWATPPIIMTDARQAASAVANTVLGLTAAPSYAPTQPAMGYSPAPVPPRARSRKPLAIGLGITGAVIVLLCVAAVALALTRGVLPIAALSGVSKPTPVSTSTLAVTPTATVPVGFKIYTDPNGSYQLIMPDSWGTSSKEGVASFVQASPPAFMAIASQNQTFNSSDITTNEAEFFHSMSIGAGGSGSYTIVGKPSIVLQGHAIWTQETADITVKQDTLRAVVLIANHNDTGYLISYAASRTDFAKVNTEDFQPIVQSFEFLS